MVPKRPRVIVVLPLLSSEDDFLASSPPSSAQPASSPAPSDATAARTTALLRADRVRARIASSCCPDVPTPRPTALLDPLVLAAARVGNVRDVYVSGTVGALPLVMC